MTYEIMTPESVGQNATNLVLGKHSGRNTFGARLKSLGHDLEKEALNAAFKKFKALADAGDVITDDVLNTLARNG